MPSPLLSSCGVYVGFSAKVSLWPSGLVGEGKASVTQVGHHRHWTHVMSAHDRNTDKQACIFPQCQNLLNNNFIDNLAWLDGLG